MFSVHKLPPPRQVRLAPGGFFLLLALVALVIWSVDRISSSPDDSPVTIDTVYVDTCGEV